MNEARRIPGEDCSRRGFTKYRDPELRMHSPEGGARRKLMGLEGGERPACSNIEIIIYSFCHVRLCIFEVKISLYTIREMHMDE